MFSDLWIRRLSLLKEERNLLFIINEHLWVTTRGQVVGSGNRMDGCVWTILHAVLLWLWFWFATICLFASLSPGWFEIYYIAKDDLHPQLSLPFSTYAVGLLYLPVLNLQIQPVRDRRIQKRIIYTEHMWTLFRTRPHCIVQAGLELPAILLQPP